MKSLFLIFKIILSAIAILLILSISPVLIIHLPNYIAKNKIEKGNLDTKCIYFIDYKSLAYHGNQYIVKIGDDRYFGYQIETDEEFPFHKKQRKFFQDMRNNNDKNKCHLAKVKTIRKFILKRIYVYDVHN